MNIVDLIKFFKEFSLEKFSLSTGDSGGKTKVLLSAKNLQLKDPASEGCLIEELILSLEDVNIVPDIYNALKDSWIKISSFSFSLSQDFVNNALSLMPELKEKGVNDLKIRFENERITLKGSYKKILSFPFAIDLKAEIADKNIIKVELEKFWMLEMIPLPKMMQNAIFGTLKGHFKDGAIRLVDNYFLIDVLSFIPFPIEVKFKSIESLDKFLRFVGGS